MDFIIKLMSCLGGTFFAAYIVTLIDTHFSFAPIKEEQEGPVLYITKEINFNENN